MNIWENYTVTNMVSKSFSDGDKNVSIYLISHDWFGSASITDTIRYYSSNYATTSLRPYLNITYEESAPSGTQYNETGLLSFSLTSQNCRILNTSRTDSLSLSIASASYRKANLQRTSTLSMTLTTDATSVLQRIYSFLSSLTMTLTSNSYRQAILKRIGTASLSFSIASSRQGILNRLATLTTTISTLAEATKSAGAQTYERVASLVMSLSSNSYRSAILNRLKTLIITIISGRSVYTPSEKMYETCAVLWKFPRSDRIYLCIYTTKTYKILIKGTDFHA